MVRRIAAAGLAAAVLAAGAASADDDQPAGPPTCSAVTARFSHAPRDRAPREPSPRGIELWVQCTYQAGQLNIHANRDLTRVGRPTLYNADEGDALACTPALPRRAGCRGEVGQDARIAVRLVLRRSLCKGDPLRLRVTAFGGIDCDDGLPCPSIGYFSRVRTKPLAC